MGYRRVDAACGVLTLLAVVAPSPRAFALQSIRLNGPLPRPKAGAVQFDYRISPDGTRAAYRADQVHDNVIELFSAPVDGSAPAVRLHDPQVATSQADVLDVEIGAGGRALFRADLGTNETIELYSAPLDASASPIVLAGTLIAGGDVTSFRLTPDGTRAVYLADALVDGRSELFAVAVDGSSAPVRLDPLDRAAGSLYRVTPAGDVVLFVTSLGIGRERMHAVPIDASALPVPLADSDVPPVPLDTSFVSVAIAEDGLHAAYVREDFFLDRGDIHVFELFGLELDGSPAPAKLSLDSTSDEPPPHAIAGERVVYLEPSAELYTIRTDGTGRVLLAANAGEFALAPDGSKVTFLAGAFGEDTLYVAPVDGSSAPTVLAGPGELESPRFSASSDLVLFIGSLPSAFRGLFAVPATGGTPLLLNAPEIAGERGAEDFVVSPLGGAIVYREDRVAAGVLELFSVDLGLEPHRLSGPLADHRDVVSYRIAPDGEHAVYLADEVTEATYELFGAPIDGSTPSVRLNPTFPDGPVAGRVEGFRTTPDETRVVYLASQESPLFDDLFATHSNGHGAPVRLTAPLSGPPTSTLPDVGPGFVLSASGSRVVFPFRLGPTVSNAELYAATTDGTGSAVWLDASTAGFQTPYVIDPSDTFVVYRAHDPELLDALVLRRANLDGSQTGFNLASSLFASILDFELMPDASAVIYRAAQDAPSQIDLYRVPSAGGVPLRLNTPPFAGADVVALRVTPDGSRVVYRGTQQTSSSELFSVPSDGSGAPVKLNGALAGSGQVLGFTLTPLGALYNATQVASNRNELFAAPFDGSSVALRLTVLPAGHNGVQSDYRASADGTLAFYRTDANTLAVPELFVVPTDASASPVKLSGTLVAGGSVGSFAISPDQQRVVYLADQRLDELFELFSVPAAGGPAIALMTLPAFADVTTYRIDPDSIWAVYLADAGADNVVDLWRVPLDGSAPPQRINQPLPASGDVQTDFVPLSGGGIVYRADRVNDQAIELFRFLDIEIGDPLLPAAEPTRARTVLR